MHRFFLFSLLCGACLAIPIDIENGTALGINNYNNNWEIDVKSADGEYQKNPATQLEPLHEVLHVYHVPLTIPLYTSIVVHDKNQYQEQTEQPQDTAAKNPHGRDSDEKLCQAPTDAGFTRLFAEVYQTLPKQQIIKIIRNANKYDSQVRAFRNMLFSKAIIEKLNAIEKSNEFQELNDYACKRLYMNMQNYLKIVRLFIACKQEEYGNAISHGDDDDEKSSEEIEFSDFKGRPGVRGLIQDIYDILPHEQLQQLYKRLKNTDYYLAYGIRNIKAPEFRRLLENLRFVPAYRELKDMLIKAGLPLNEYNKLIIAAIGWENDQDVFTV